ncbi:hypothetical protein BDW59DRAFT_146287 [Aspergillus cavernicola]|uniref:Uncharacterized protein n=1 Tax=Aspergillus cavernicola TaxID=176166 RepID=A0ABR4ICL8_9EURO
MTDKRIWRHQAWFRYYRMILFHPRKPICHLSGTSYFTGKDDQFETVQVPWDENTVVIRPEARDKSLLATALIHDYEDEPVEDRLTGIMMHTRCWQILQTHKTWSIYGGDIKLILRALRLKSARDWKPLQNYSNLAFDLKSWPVSQYGIDLYTEPNALRIIQQARRRRKKRFKVIRCRRTTYLNYLPAEILFMIANLVQPQEVEATQEAIGSYLGDRYWQSRIPTYLYETLPLSGEILDWQYLCLALERQGYDFWRIRLQGRWWVLGQLDEIAGFAGS